MNTMVDTISVEEARTVELTVPTLAAPAELPNSLKLKPLHERYRMNFLPKMCGNSFLMFETALYNIAGSLSDNYNGGYWEFVQLKDVQNGFYCFPDDDAFECANNMNYASGFLDGRLFGVLVSLLALNSLAWKTKGIQQERFVNTFHGVKDKIFDDLYQIATTSEEIEEVLKARQASKMLYMFLD